VRETEKKRKGKGKGRVRLSTSFNTTHFLKKRKTKKHISPSLSPKHRKHREIDKRKHNMDQLLGPHLLSPQGSVISTTAALEGKELVLLYFSASW
jgi:hypothetical protein